MLQNDHMQSCDAHNGNDCNCSDWNDEQIDMAMMGPMKALTPEEAAAAKQARKEQSAGAREAYFREMDRSGNKEYAKLAARYGAHGAALECVDAETRAPSFWTIGNGERYTPHSGHRCKMYLSEEHAPEYIVPELRPGTCYSNRRPGARSGWAIGFAGEEDCDGAEFVRVIEIDGSSCHVFRKHYMIEGKSVTRYLAATRVMSRKRIAPTGDCSDITPAWLLCQHNGNHRTPQIVRVFVAAERCV